MTHTLGYSVNDNSNEQQRGVLDYNSHTIGEHPQQIQHKRNLWNKFHLYTLKTKTFESGTPWGSRWVVLRERNISASLSPPSAPQHGQNHPTLERQEVERTHLETVSAAGTVLLRSVGSTHGEQSQLIVLFGSFSVYSGLCGTWGKSLLNLPEGRCGGVAKYR